MSLDADRPANEANRRVEPPRGTADDGEHEHAPLEPTLDRTNRRHLRGCIEDWTIDLRVDVVSFATSR